MSWSIARRFALPPLLAVLSAACGGGFGDPAGKPLADAYGDGARIHEIVGPADWYDESNEMSVKCAQPADHAVYVTGATILAIDRFDETGDGQLGNYYVEDSPFADGTAEEDPKDVKYPGVTVFAPTFSPPDLRLAEGDVVDMNGLFQEFLGPSTAGNFGLCRTLPELSGTLSFRFDGNRALVPRVVDDVNLLKNYETARPFIGRLIKLTNVVIALKATNKGGRYTAPLFVNGTGQTDVVPFVTNELYDMEKEGPALDENGTFTSVTGIGTYFYGFHIAPRSPADFEP
jgi:hypothetical protein